MKQSGPAIEALDHRRQWTQAVTRSPSLPVFQIVGLLQLHCQAENVLTAGIKLAQPRGKGLPNC